MTDAPKGLRIVALTAENVKKLRAVEIHPTGDVVTISGRNGAGKTSVLDSIWWALAGTSHIQAQPIRKGANKARIRLDMGELIVERKFSESGSTLSVETAEGAKYSSPQKMLDALLGALSFDPLDFARMDPRAQFEALRRVSKLDVDIEKLNMQNKGDYDRRTEVNREAKAKRAAAQAVNVPREPVQTLEQSEADILDEMQTAGDLNTKREREIARRKGLSEDCGRMDTAASERRSRAAQLRRQADELDEEAHVLEQQARLKREEIGALPELPDANDISALREKLEEAKRTSAALQAIERRRVLEQEAADLEQAAVNLTAAIEARDQAKADAVARAEMPVPGLGFGDGVVMLNDVPFDQASDAEKLKASLGIAIAANPRVRVIRIRDGSLLDDASLATVADMARANDCQVWIERVDTSGKIGIVIDDGAVVAVNPEPGETDSLFEKGETT